MDADSDSRGPGPGAPISLTGVTRAFGDRQVLDGVSFTAHPGRVTGYLGPNGSGKTTTIRVLLGLTEADAGTATIAGRSYREMHRPARTVGVLLENAGLHPGLTPARQLALAAAPSEVPRARIDRVLDEVGLTSVTHRRIRTFSQGMRQRLGIALALLADPEVLILDEPANGLDPDGMIWLRGLLRGYAARGATVLVTSHVLAELERVVDDVVVIAGGRVLAQRSIDDLPDGTDLEGFYLCITTPANHQEAQS